MCGFRLQMRVITETIHAIHTLHSLVIFSVTSCYYAILTNISETFYTLYGFSNTEVGTKSYAHMGHTSIISVIILVY
jgi:hypothetical protein